MSIASSADLEQSPQDREIYSVNSYNVDSYTKKNSQMIKKSFMSENGVDL